MTHKSKLWTEIFAAWRNSQLINVARFLISSKIDLFCLCNGRWPGENENKKKLSYCFSFLSNHLNITDKELRRISKIWLFSCEIAFFCKQIFRNFVKFWSFVHIKGKNLAWCTHCCSVLDLMPQAWYALTAGDSRRRNPKSSRNLASEGTKVRPKSSPSFFIFLCSKWEESHPSEVPIMVNENIGIIYKTLLQKKLVLKILPNYNRNTTNYCSHNNWEWKKN